MWAILVGVRKGGRIVTELGPTGSVEHPTVLGQGTVLRLPRLEIFQGQAVVRVRGTFSHLVNNHRRSHESLSGYLAYVIETLTGHPVIGGIKVRTCVLPRAKVVPIPGRSTIVVGTDLLQLEGRRLPELRRQSQDRRSGVQR